MAERIALFPGSFDPITNGHVDILDRGSRLFDKIIIAIGINAQKQSSFSLDVRLSWLQQIYGSNPKIEIVSYTGLTVDLCREKGAGFILRGLRNTTDFEYEKTIAAVNQSMLREVETIFIMTSPASSHIHSTIVRELIKYKGKFEHLVPACVADGVKKLYI